MNQNEEIGLRTLDLFCRENKIKHINFLKLDVEGHEKKVLDGASSMLRIKAIDFIQFKLGGCNIDSRTYFQDFFYLLNKNYTVHRIAKDGLFPINEYKETHEASITTNFLAERKSISPLQNSGVSRG